MNITNKRTRGAVSVFLVMILVPCIVVTSVFVDLGRVHMSKSMAESASDLALNSLLTNYDSDLNEWYGMVASCQNIDEFYEKSAKFFLRTLSSQGLSDDEIYLLSDYYANATNDDTIYDLLQVECQTDTSGMISAVSGANLSNSTLIKEQVVEFMKYRAPIEMTTSIIDRLKSDTTVTQAIEAEENTPLVEDKTAYYEAEGELLAAAFNSYIAIYDYFKEASTNNLTNDKLQNYTNKLTTYKNTYSEIHKLMITNLYNTSGLSIYHRRVYALDSYNTTYTKTSDEVHSRKETIDGTEHYYIDGSKITSILNTLEEEIQDFNDAKSSFITASESLMNKLPGDSESSSNYIQWWVQMNNAVNSSSGTNHTTNFSRAAENMLKAYSKALAIKECELGEEVPSAWEERFNELTGQVSELQGKYLKTNQPANGDAYLKTVSKLEEVSAANIYKISSSNLSVNVDGQTLTIDQAIPYVKTQLSTIRSELRKYVRLLDIAIDGNEDDEEVPEAERVKSLDQLLALANTYHSKLNTWTNTANGSTTTMGEENREEIASIEQVCQQLNEASVRELKTRLSNIRSQIQDIIDAIDDMKYGNKTVKSIDSYSTFKSEASTKVQSSSIKLKNSDLSNYASSTFGQLFTPTSSTVLTLGHLSDSNYNPQINPVTKEVNTPQLFVYFHGEFQGMSRQDVTDKQDELDGGEAEGNTQQDAAKNKGRYHGGGSEISKEFSGDKTFSLADGAISGVIDLFESLINLDITNIRDDLYVTTYIMNMFSYATYEEEGIYQLVEKKNELYLPTSGYRPTQYENLLGNATTEKTWLSEKPTDGYNKSLTNKMINKTNNAAYAAEIEYILYGGRTDKGNDDNVKAVYSNIYGLRYALNLVSGFQHFWSTGNSTANAIEAVARAIQMATSGIIPAELTKVILIPILTIFETSKDLDRLEAGFPVELYKTSHSDWWIKVPDGSDVKSVSGLTSIFKNAFNGPNTDKGIYYSDYLTVFVYLGLKSSAEDDMLQRMAEVIQTNIGKKIGGESGYSLSKSQVYFNLKATIKVKPLMITLPIFNDYNNNMETETDWCTYQINTTRGY